MGRVILPNEDIVFANVSLARIDPFTMSYTIQTWYRDGFVYFSGNRPDRPIRRNCMAGEIIARIPLRLVQDFIKQYAVLA